MPFMLHQTISDVKDRIDRELLPYVRKPGRYIGGEMNQVHKDLNACRVRLALCFPDSYEIAMSHTGLAILYEAVNRVDRWAAERVFAPWTDAEAVMRDKHLPLFSLESCAPVREFDLVGFSLTNELCYTNFLNMLDLAGLKVRSAQRTEDDPIVLVGGQAANYAEPLAAFADLFVLGEGEEALVGLLTLYEQVKADGGDKETFLLQAARRFSCVYVPRFYVSPQDAADEHPDAFLSPLVEGVPVRFENAVVSDFENAVVPSRPVVPFVQAVHERISVEIMRGCPGRCRFCQASFCRRPVRYRSPDRILEIAQAHYEQTGYDTISLLSLSTADYPYLDELLDKLRQYFEPLHVGLSVPSLKVQKQLELLPKMVAGVRKSGLTIAVEAASEPLRKRINKPIADADLFAAVRAAYQAGFRRVKLYFMVGFPGETEADIAAMVDLSYHIARLRKEVDGHLASVNAAVSWLVPKPHTPFGWLGQKDAAYFENARAIILNRKRELNARAVQFKFHRIERSVLESALGRGDRRLAEVIELAWKNGARFDLWDETFDFALWQRAFETVGLDVHAAAQHTLTPGQILPWAHLGGPEEKTLRRHYDEAMKS
ncbi:MAG TPA: TIGR03960 family B12-binding radical SAM protein [Phycisphaerales bacterium]|nr:TIGR03960 family B12-binding radical SAM protein [Phycisphaerales bacterium]